MVSMKKETEFKEIINQNLDERRGKSGKSKTLLLGREAERSWLEDPTRVIIFSHKVF
jgi:hypothetical protein